ncbi:hypothetical protein FRX31_035267, partial [Thalictrum thalictroides]
KKKQGRKFTSSSLVFFEGLHTFVKKKQGRKFTSSLVRMVALVLALKLMKRQAIGLKACQVLKRYIVIFTVLL